MRSFLKMADARGRLSITAKIYAVPAVFCSKRYETVGGFENDEICPCRMPHAGFGNCGNRRRGLHGLKLPSSRTELLSSTFVYTVGVYTPGGIRMYLKISVTTLFLAGVFSGPIAAGPAPSDHHSMRISGR